MLRNTVLSLMTLFISLSVSAECISVQGKTFCPSKLNQEMAGQFFHRNGSYIKLKKDGTAKVKFGSKSHGWIWKLRMNNGEPELIDVIDDARNSKIKSYVIYMECVSSCNKFLTKRIVNFSNDFNQIAWSPMDFYTRK